jgi:hypothetical protein
MDIAISDCVKQPTLLRICICCFSSKDAVLQSSENLLSRFQDNVSEWNDVPTCFNELAVNKYN